MEVYNPDEDALEKAVFIATKLGTKVQGDKGEIYHQWMFNDKTPSFEVLYRPYQ